MTTSIELSKIREKKFRRRNLWFERAMALLASGNLVLVIFDLTYIPLRDTYVQELPGLTRYYDPVKAIEPHRHTQEYLDTAEALEVEIATSGLTSPGVDPLLAQLRQLSAEMVDENPFQLANKTGTLERVKNLMRSRIGLASAKDSFSTFWSRPYLTQTGWQNELAFYKRRIRPLMATNYWRPYSETGNFVNRFWIIDLPFVLIFALEFLLRTHYLYRRHAGLRWIDAMTWRWYDIFLVIPFSGLHFASWALLRTIPVIIRLHQAQLVNLEPLRQQISQVFVANIAQDMTEVVLVQLINQLQHSIKQGEIARWLSQGNSKTYIDINNINETVAITQLLSRLLVNEVFPKVQPEVEALLQHNIVKILHQSNAYQGLQRLPGMNTIEGNLTERLTKELTQSIYDTLRGVLEPDPVGDKLTQQLFGQISEAFRTEMQAKQTLNQIEYLLHAFLEEVKINYVARLSEEDMREILAQTRALHRSARLNSASVRVIR